MIVSHYRAYRRGSLTAKLITCTRKEAAATDNSSRANVLHRTVNCKPNKENYHVPA